jgi:hypothetical protein
MRRIPLAIRLLPAVLLAYMACQPRPSSPTVFAPWEEGLTLAYEDPSLPQPLRSERRLQIRVAHSDLSLGGPSLIHLDLTSLRGQLSMLVRPRDGGSELVEEGGRIIATVLPAHFPNLTAWVDHGVEFRVLGRGAWEGAAILPSGSDPVGVWVEARAPQGIHRRTLYLPNLGEVEAREERNGTWVIVNLLVARGFTDLPVIQHP